MGSFRRVKIVKWAPFEVPSTRWRFTRYLVSGDAAFPGARFKFVDPQISFRVTLNCITLACVVFSCFDNKVASQYVDVVTVTVTLDWTKQQYNGTSSGTWQHKELLSELKQSLEVATSADTSAVASHQGWYSNRAILILNFEQVSPAPSVPTSSILSCFDSSSPSFSSSESAGEGSPAPETRQYWLIPFSPFNIWEGVCKMTVMCNEMIFLKKNENKWIWFTKVFIYICKCDQ